MDRLENYVKNLSDQNNYKRNSKTIAVATLPFAIMYNATVIESFIKEQMLFLGYKEDEKFNSKFGAIKKDIKTDLELMGFDYGIKDSKVPKITNCSDFLKNVLHGLDWLNVYTNKTPKYLNSNKDSYDNYKTKILIYISQIKDFLPIKIDKQERDLIISNNSYHVYDVIKKKGVVGYMEPAEMFAISLIAESKNFTERSVEAFKSWYTNSYINIINNHCQNAHLYDDNDLIEYYKNLNNQEVNDANRSGQILKAESKIDYYFNKYRPSDFSYGDSNKEIPKNIDFLKNMAKELIENNKVDGKQKNPDYLRRNLYNNSITYKTGISKDRVYAIMDDVLKSIEIKNDHKNDNKIKY